MCKYCNNLKKELASYDNTDSMNISYGQYRGLHIWSDLYIHGNALILSADGSYRSASDCYYEDWGLDCDNEPAMQCKDSYIKIKYCPFCGKKIESKIYELMKANEALNEATEKRDNLNNKLKNNGLFVEFVLETNEEDDVTNKYTIEELVSKFNKVKCSLYTNGFYFNKDKIFEKSSKIKFSCYDKPKFYSIVYGISVEDCEYLASLGLIKKDEKKIESFVKKENKIFNDINNLTDKIEKLKKEILILKL